MASVQHVNDLVEGFINGEISASDLANSFPPVVKSALESQDSSFRDLALAIRSQIVRYFNGVISEQQFRINLLPYAYPKPGIPSKPEQVFAMNKERELVPV